MLFSEKNLSHPCFTLCCPAWLASATSPSMLSINHIVERTSGVCPTSPAIAGAITGTLSTNRRPPPLPIKTVHVEHKRGGVVCHVFGSVCHIFCRNPLILRDFYAIRTPTAWHIWGVYFSQIWRVGVVRSAFNTEQKPDILINQGERQQGKFTHSDLLASIVVLWLMLTTGMNGSCFET